MSLGNRGGRPPKPVELHKLHGSFRKDRHGPLSQPSNGETPSDDNELWFEPDDSQALEFYNLLLDSPVGRSVQATDSAALTLAAELWVLLNKSVNVARDNPTDATARAAVVAYGGMFDRLCSRFGLTPSDRQRLRLETPPAASSSPAARYFAGVEKRNRTAFDSDIA